MDSYDPSSTSWNTPPDPAYQTDPYAPVDPYANNPGGNPALYGNGNSYGLQSQPGAIAGGSYSQPGQSGPNGSYLDPGTWIPNGPQPQGGVSGGNPGQGQGTGLMDYAPAGGQQYAANYAASGGGSGGGVTGGGGGYAPGQGLQQYPASNNGYPAPGAPGTLEGFKGDFSGGGQPLGSTVKGTPTYSQTGGGFNPNSNAYTIAKPYDSGPQNMMTMAGFKSGGAGAMPQTAYNQYQNMLSNPTDMTANPAYKAIMDASLQATQRAQLAHGGNGGGTMMAELAKTGAGVAGQYLPQMAQMYQGGAQQEAGNWNLQNQNNLQYGNLGNNMWSNAANNQFNMGTAYSNLAQGAQNTQTAAMAQAQMQPANQYFQNQLTMSGMG